MRKQYQSTAMNTSTCFLVKLSVGYQILHHVTFNIFSDSDISLHGSRRVYVEETSQHNCAAQEEERFSQLASPGDSHQGSGFLGPFSNLPLSFISAGPGGLTG